jgi:transposase
LRDLQFAIEAGDTLFAPRLKHLLLRAVAYNRRRTRLAQATRRTYRGRLERDLDLILAVAPTHAQGRRLRQRYLKYRDHLFTFLTYPEVPADNNASEHDLIPTAPEQFRSQAGIQVISMAYCDLIGSDQAPLV